MTKAKGMWSGQRHMLERKEYCLPIIGQRTGECGQSTKNLVGHGLSGTRRGLVLHINHLQMERLISQSRCVKELKTNISGERVACTERGPCHLAGAALGAAHV